ncbi:hypothetical protein HK101_007004 [Irineochytrium annulatum]|nr:hypothetical protein HK101_007004 [Irineochytrium annulatum]
MHLTSTTAPLLPTTTAHQTSTTIPLLPSTTALATTTLAFLPPPTDATLLPAWATYAVALIEHLQSLLANDAKIISDQGDLEVKLAGALKEVLDALVSVEGAQAEEGLASLVSQLTGEVFETLPATVGGVTATTTTEVVTVTGTEGVATETVTEFVASETATRPAQAWAVPNFFGPPPPLPSATTVAEVPAWMRRWH